MDTKVSLSEAYETLVQGYRKLKSIELIRELRHLTKHEGEVQNKADIVMRKSVVTELLHLLEEFCFEAFFRHRESKKNNSRIFGLFGDHMLWML